MLKLTNLQPVAKNMLAHQQLHVTGTLRLVFQKLRLRCKVLEPGFALQGEAVVFLLSFTEHKISEFLKCKLLSFDLCCDFFFFF